NHASVTLALQLLEPICPLMPLGHGDQITRDELRLIVGETPDRAVGLNQPDSEEIVELGMKGVEIEKRLLVGAEQKRVVEKRNGNFVTGREHDEIGLDLASVTEADLVAGKFGDIGLDADAAMACELWQDRAHGRVGVHDAVLGLGQAV